MLRIIRAGIVASLLSITISSFAADAPSPFQLPDTTPPGKPHFDTKGAKVGDQLPGFPMVGLDGKRLWLGDAWRDGTTLLLTSSYTCPKSRATYPQAAELARKISAGGVRVAVVYIIEAHPAGDPSPYSGKEEVTPENQSQKILCRQPKTMEERIKLANSFSKLLAVDLPIYVDEMDNAAWAMLGGGPNMGVLVNDDGIVFARQGWFDARSMESAINALVAAAKKSPPASDYDQTQWNLESTLGDLIHNDKADELRAILTNQPELDHHLMSAYSNGENLLQLAARQGALKVAKLLIERGADVNRRDGLMPSPLNLATDNAALTELLIQHGADVNVKSLGYGPTPLQTALFEKRETTAAALLKLGAKPNFYTAAATGDLAALQADFLQDPTIISRPDGEGHDALAYAVKTGHADSVKTLLSLGARDLCSSRYGGSALVQAIRDDNPAIVRELLEHGSNPNRLYAGIAEDIPVDFVRMMLDHKADPNGADHRDLPPFLAAIAYGRQDIMQMLLNAGADANVKTLVGNGLFCGPSYSEGDAALHIAIENKHPELLAFLFKRDVKVNVANKTSVTPLHEAARQEAEAAAETVRLLIEHHADINPADESGDTPLHYAADNKGEDAAKIVQMLLDQHAGVNVADKQGVTPLHLAVGNSGKCGEEITRKLIEHQANVNAKTKDGRTPLDYTENQTTGLFGSQERDMGSVVELLKKHGAVKGKPVVKKG